MAFQNFQKQQEDGFDHRMVDLRRVTRVVKGGRRFRFRATVIVGDKRGQVGMGVAKGADVQTAISKAQEAAKKNIIRFILEGGTIPHEITRTFRGATVFLKPAPQGSGIIAGGPIRSVALLGGLRDLSSKMMGSHNRLNVVRATMMALEAMQERKVKPSKKSVETKVEETKGENNAS
jgi:small subunit ribosomal protein S5